MEQINSFTKEFTFKDNNYTFSMNKCTGGFNLRVSKPLDLNYWENVIDYYELQKQYPFLYMKEEKFCEYIYNFMQLNQYNLALESETMWLEFWMILEMGSLSDKLTFNIPLTNKKGEVTENLSNLATHLKKVENNYEKYENTLTVKMREFESKINIRVSGLESEFKDKMKIIFDEIIDKNEKNLKELKKEFADVILKEKDKFELARLEMLREKENNKPVESKLLDCLINNINNTGNVNKLYPKLINPDNVSCTLSNDNRTVEKISGGSAFVGFRGEEIPSTPGTYQFSIRIDKTDANCHIMIGFCLNSHVGTSGFYSGSNCLGMLYLYNGQIYCPSIVALTANNFRGTTGIIITAIIDTFNKFVCFKMNGYQIQSPKNFILNDGDISKICPCIDLHTQGVKVTIVNI